MQHNIHNIRIQPKITQNEKNQEDVTNFQDKSTCTYTHIHEHQLLDDSML